MVEQGSMLLECLYSEMAQDCLKDDPPLTPSTQKNVNRHITFWMVPGRCFWLPQQHLYTQRLKKCSSATAIAHHTPALSHRRRRPSQSEQASGVQRESDPVGSVQTSGSESLTQTRSDIPTPPRVPPPHASAPGVKGYWLHCQSS